MNNIGVRLNGMWLKRSSQAVCVALSLMPVLALAEYKEEFHQTYPFSEKGEVRLDNVNGAVVITGWDRNEVKLDAVKRARVEADLPEVKIDVQASTDKISISTKYPQRKSFWIFGTRNNSTSVAYELKVPRQAHLAKISTVNGGIVISDVRGPVDASTVNGGLKIDGLHSECQLSTVNGSAEATFGSLAGVQSIHMSTVNGSAVLRVPQLTDADISATTVNGSVKNDHGIALKKNGNANKELHTRLGNGKTRIRLSTVNGSVMLNKIAGGEPPEAKVEK
ncbi:MAG TPA: hypothetical protein P5186_03670 [Candidatus Paceibacterota bacterium]|nr:hypothetical protein [Verrucomicrobiota bacterium]HRY47125.1 hypothetical protein [Candidatus Paceibacterota bacterium]HSA00564.1 hypothetical protein [Candidatus Paceibacterota bacterium]